MREFLRSARGVRSQALGVHPGLGSERLGGMNQVTPVDYEWLLGLWRAYVIEERMDAWHPQEETDPRQHWSWQGTSIDAAALADLLHNSFSPDLDKALVGLCQRSLYNEGADRWLAWHLRDGGWSLAGLHTFVAERDWRDLDGRLDQARATDASVAALRP